MSLSGLAWTALRIGIDLGVLAARLGLLAVEEAVDTVAFLLDEFEGRRSS